jgi:VanZ family protein
MTRPSSAFLRHSATVFCALVWIAAATATHIPIQSLGEVPVSDLFLHFNGYLGLTCIFLVTLRLHKVRWLRRVWIGLPVILVYSALDESTQSLVGRYSCFEDWFANLAGIAAAFGLDTLIHFLQHWRKPRTKTA